MAELEIGGKTGGGRVRGRAGAFASGSWSRGDAEDKTRLGYGPRLLLTWVLATSSSLIQLERFHGPWVART
jgi:hypothetical protein